MKEITFNQSMLGEQETGRVFFTIKNSEKDYEKVSFVNLINKNINANNHINILEEDYEKLNKPKDNNIYFITDVEPKTLEETYSPSDDTERLNALIDDYDITYDKLGNITGSSLETKLNELIANEN